MNRSRRPSRLLVLSLAALASLACAGLTAPAASAEPAAGGKGVKLTQEDNRVVVTIDGKPFTDYYYGPTATHPYVRPYLYPVLAPDGVGVTSDQIDVPGGDHPHHRSLYVAHGDVNGVDHWSLEKQLKGGKQPQQKHMKFEKVEGDALVEDLEWEDDSGKPLLRERRTVRFFEFPDAEHNRGIDFAIELTPADGPVKFGDTKEAGLCSVRMAVPITKTATVTESTGAHASVAPAPPEGADKAALRAWTKENDKNEQAVWGKTADWCDESGQINGKTYGAAILDNPANLRHPTHWHVRLYGLMAANNFGSQAFDKNVKEKVGEYTLEPGKALTFKYEVVVHEGNPEQAKIAEKYKEYVKEGK